MTKRTLFIFLLVGLTAFAGCHTGARTSVRADYYSGGRYAPYYYYDPFYPPYFYDPYPSFFFRSSFFYGYPYYYPFYPYPYFIIRERALPPGSRSLRGFRTLRRTPSIGDGRTSRSPSGRSGEGTSGDSRGGRRLR
jgi:hypothetical protein